MDAVPVDPKDAPFDIQKAEPPNVIGSPLEMYVANMIAYGATSAGIAKHVGLTERQVRRLREKPNVKALVERYKHGIPGLAGADLINVRYPLAVQKLGAMMDDSDKHVRLAAIKAFTKLAVDLQKMSVTNIQVNLLTGLTAQGRAQAKSDAEVRAEAELAHDVVGRYLERGEEKLDE